MRRLIAGLLAGAAAVSASPQARANFVLVPEGPGASAGATARTTKPIVLNADPNQQANASQPKVTIARGFGDHVPLAFATKQIVPAQIRVTFGPKVDQSATVSWTGGGPWHETLRTALRPLGLHVDVGWKVVAITKG